MQLCLPFQREIFTDLVDQDGLLILAKGLGLTQILLALLQLAVERQTLILLVNVQSAEEEELQLQLAALTNGQTTLKILKNDTKAEDR
jgi:DNA excision repair protein ERCC-4